MFHAGADIGRLSYNNGALTDAYNRVCRASVTREASRNRDLPLETKSDEFRAKREGYIAREILLLIKCISYYPKNSRKISILEWLTFH